jgi:Lar family restriction alleviation protein
METKFRGDVILKPFFCGTIVVYIIIRWVYKWCHKSSQVDLLVIKPCPFCGRDARITTYKFPDISENDKVSGYQICCSNSQCFVAITTLGHDRKEDAINAWNIRAL